MGVSRSPSNSPMPSAPNASLTPSNRPMLSAVDLGCAMGGMNAEERGVAASRRVVDFIFALILSFYIGKIGGSLIRYYY